MLPKLEGLPLRTDKVQAAGVFTLKSIVSLTADGSATGELISRLSSLVSFSLCQLGLSSLGHFTAAVVIVPFETPGT